MDPERAVEIILDQIVPVSEVPPRALRLGLGVQATEGLSILCVGAGLPVPDAEALLASGCQLARVGTLVEAIVAMGQSDYDLVAVSPSFDDEADGIQFVRVLKVGDVTQIDESIGGIASRYQQVPFVILPLEGSSEYAVYETSDEWYLGDASELPLARAILALRN